MNAVRPRVPRPPSHFQEQLVEQVDFLRQSSAAFDAGREHEAKRLAVTIRVLVHSTKNSQSLLHHLGVRERWRFLDTTGGGTAFPPHVGSSLTAQETWTNALGPQFGRYVALLGDGPEGIARNVTFGHWWRNLVVRDRFGEQFGRADLVLALANQDGGAHVDAKIEARILALAHDNSLGAQVAKPDAEHADFQNNFVLQAVRQIAYELEQTITRYERI